MSGNDDQPVAVGFDFDHTLGLDNGLETKAFYEFAVVLGHPISDSDDAWSAFIGDALARFRAGSIPMERAVEEFVARLGLAPQPDHTEQYRTICYSLVDRLVEPIDGAAEVLATLADWGIPTAILTNGWSPLQYLKIARALDYRGPILVSDELGRLKPDPLAFEKLVEVLGVPRAAIWFVGDNPTTDIAGAQRAGLRGVWFDWEELVYPKDAPKPNVRIEALRDLLDLLPGRNVATENVR